MNDIELGHPTSAQLAAFGVGQLAEGDLAQIESHLAHCSDCRQIAEGVADGVDDEFSVIGLDVDDRGGEEQGRRNCCRAKYQPLYAAPQGRRPGGPRTTKSPSWSTTKA